MATRHPHETDAGTDGQESLPTSAFVSITPTLTVASFGHHLPPAQQRTRTRLIKCVLTVRNTPWTNMTSTSWFKYFLVGLMQDYYCTYFPVNKIVLHEGSIKTRLSLGPCFMVARFVLCVGATQSELFFSSFLLPCFGYLDVKMS